MLATDERPLGDTSALPEARRMMEVCNACRYCEGVCPVFPAMELHRSFSNGDLGHLANLCHNCKSCYHSCQYTPPHEWGLNLPKTFAEVRAETYAQHAWPKGLGEAFEKNGLVVSLVAAVSLGAVLILTMLLQSNDILFGTHSGPGAFYAVIPHGAMAWLGGLTFLYAIVAMVMGALSYWRESGGGPLPASALHAALKDAGRMRHLGGDGEGCNDMDESFGMGRKHLHLAMMWGFALCFAATCAGTVMDYVLGWQAPYNWYSLPVVLGTVGGVGLIVGTSGLFVIKFRTDRRPEATARWGMDLGLLALLNLTALTGIALLLVRHTGAMGVTLAIHLGFVLALFLTLPYGKMVHGIYRLLALARYHRDRETH